MQIFDLELGGFKHTASLLIGHRVQGLSLQEFQGGARRRKKDLTRSVVIQEREDAEKAFASGQADVLDAEEATVSKTFEPGEGIAAAEGDQEQGAFERMRESKTPSLVAMLMLRLSRFTFLKTALIGFLYDQLKFLLLDQRTQ